MENKAIDEQLLIAECKKGNASAQKTLYNLYAPTMMVVCSRYAGDKESARDMLQEGFIKLFTKIDSYSGTGAFNGWVRKVFITTALEMLRKQNVLRFAVSIDDYNESFEDMEHSIIDKMSIDDLTLCISKLPEGYRAVFNLFAIEGYSHAEIAELLRITEGSSRLKYVRARKMLQENIKIMFEDYHMVYAELKVE